jgi:histidyl-tRNA synthetase
LVEQLGGKPTPAVGFAMGIERLCLLLETLAVAPAIPALADVFIVSVGDGAEIAALTLAEAIRTALPTARVLINCGGGSFKSQFKKADKSGAALAIVLGEDELAQGHAAVKSLRDSQSEQQLVALAELPDYIGKHFFTKF